MALRRAAGGAGRLRSTDAASGAAAAAGHTGAVLSRGWLLAQATASPAAYLAGLPPGGERAGGEWFDRRSEHALLEVEPPPLGLRGDARPRVGKQRHAGYPQHRRALG